MRAKRIGAAFLAGSFTVAHVAATLGLLGAPDALNRDTYDGGWSAAVSGDATEFPDWRGNGKDQTRLLYKDYKEVHGIDYVPRNQGSAPSCVGQATAAAVDFLAAVEIRTGDQERGPPAQAAACVLYGLSRIEIGGMPAHAAGGSHNLWASQAVQQYGVVASLNYPLLNQDLRVPSATRAIEFGSKGIPLGLEKIAKIHPVKEYIRISSYDDLRDAIYMGCPVIVGSNVGFGEGQLRRDRDGFLNRPRRLFWDSRWQHSMCFIGVCDSGRRGALIINSWGANWISGPQRFGDEPEGSFWVDAVVVDQMVKQGDSFALRGFHGYQNYRLWTPKD